MKALKKKLTIKIPEKIIDNSSSYSPPHPPLPISSCRWDEEQKIP